MNSKSGSQLTLAPQHKRGPEEQHLSERSKKEKKGTLARIRSTFHKKKKESNASSPLPNKPIVIPKASTPSKEIKKSNTHVQSVEGFPTHEGSIVDNENPIQRQPNPLHLLDSAEFVPGAFGAAQHSTYTTTSIVSGSHQQKGMKGTSSRNMTPISKIPQLMFDSQTDPITPNRRNLGKECIIAEGLEPEESQFLREYLGGDDPAHTFSKMRESLGQRRQNSLPSVTPQGVYLNADRQSDVDDDQDTLRTETRKDKSITPQHFRRAMLPQIKRLSDDVTASKEEVSVMVEEKEPETGRRSTTNSPRVEVVKRSQSKPRDIAKHDLYQAGGANIEIDPNQIQIYPLRSKQSSMTVPREPLPIKTFTFSKLDESPSPRQIETSSPEPGSPLHYVILGTSQGLVTEQGSPTEMFVMSPQQEMSRVHTKALRCSWDKHKKKINILKKKGYQYSSKEIQKQSEIQERNERIQRRIYKGMQIRQLVAPILEKRGNKNLLEYQQFIDQGTIISEEEFRIRSERAHKTGYERLLSVGSEETLLRKNEIVCDITPVKRTGRKLSDTEDIIETLAEKVGLRTISQASGGRKTAIESTGNLSPVKQLETEEEAGYGVLRMYKTEGSQRKEQKIIEKEEKESSSSLRRSSNTVKTLKQLKRSLTGVESRRTSNRKAEEERVENGEDEEEERALKSERGFSGSSSQLHITDIQIPSIRQTGEPIQMTLSNKDDMSPNSSPRDSPTGPSQGVSNKRSANNIILMPSGTLEYYQRGRGSTSALSNSTSNATIMMSAVQFANFRRQQHQQRQLNYSSKLEPPEKSQVSGVRKMSNPRKNYLAPAAPPPHIQRQAFKRMMQTGGTGNSLNIQALIPSAPRLLHDKTETATLNQTLPVTQNQSQSLLVGDSQFLPTERTGPQDQDENAKVSSYIYSPIVLGSARSSQATVAAQRYLHKSGQELSSLRQLKPSRVQSAKSHKEIEEIVIRHEPLALATPPSPSYQPPKSLNYKPESERRVMMARLKQRYRNPGSQFLIDTVKTYEIQPQEVIDENFVFTPSSTSKAHRLKQKPSLSNLSPTDSYNFLIRPSLLAATNSSWASPAQRKSIPGHQSRGIMADRGNSVQHDLQLPYEPKLEPQQLPHTAEGVKGQMEDTVGMIFNNVMHPIRTPVQLQRAQVVSAFKRAKLEQEEDRQKQGDIQMLAPNKARNRLTKISNINRAIPQSKNRTLQFGRKSAKTVGKSPRKNKFVTLLEAKKKSGMEANKDIPIQEQREITIDLKQKQPSSIISTQRTLIESDLGASFEKRDSSRSYKVVERVVDPFGLEETANQPYQIQDDLYNQPILAVQRTNQPGVKSAHWTVSSCLQSYCAPLSKTMSEGRNSPE